MPTSFRDVFVQFSLISLFVFAMFSFVIVFQIENNGPSSLLDNELINSTFSDLGDNLRQQKVDSNDTQTSFDSDIPEPGFGSLIVFAIVGAAQKTTSTITGIYNLLIILPISALGLPDILTNVLGSILTITLVFLAWRVYRVGS